jgi:hypothetical protein
MLNEAVRVQAEREAKLAFSRTLAFAPVTPQGLTIPHNRVQDKLSTLVFAAVLAFLSAKPSLILLKPGRRSRS